MLAKQSVKTARLENGRLHYAGWPHTQRQDDQLHQA